MEELIDGISKDIINAALNDVLGGKMPVHQTPREQLLAMGLHSIVENNLDFISSNAGYFAGSIRFYVDEIELFTNKGGSDMRRSILECTKRIILIFAYQDQLREEYEAKMIEAYDKCYRKEGD